MTRPDIQIFPGMSDIHIPILVTPSSDAMSDTQVHSTPRYSDTLRHVAVSIPNQVSNTIRQIDVSVHSAIEHTFAVGIIKQSHSIMLLMLPYILKFPMPRKLWMQLISRYLVHDLISLQLKLHIQPRYPDLLMLIILEVLI